MKARFGGGAQLHSHGKWPSLMSCSWLCSLPEGKWFELWVSHVFAPLLVRTRLELCKIICEWGMSQRTRGYPANKHMLRKIYNSQIRNSTLFWGSFCQCLSRLKNSEVIVRSQKISHGTFSKEIQEWFFFTCWIWPSLGSMFNFGHVGHGGQGLITLSKNCPSVGGVWTPAGRTSVRLFQISGVPACFCPTKSGHPKNAKKKRMNWSQFGGITKKTRATLSSEKPSWFGFHPIFCWQNPLVRLTRSPFCWLNRSIPIAAGKIPTCGTSGLKTNRVFSMKNHALCCCIWSSVIMYHLVI